MSEAADMRDQGAGTRAGGAALPPDIVATPADLQAHPDEEIPWWTPSWSESIRHMGWRWVLIVPVVLVAGAGVALLYYSPRRNAAVIGIELKLLKLAVAIAVPLGLFVIRKAAQSRTEPFCIHCGYNLTGLPDNHRCPECGRPYSWRVIAEYRRDPEGFKVRWKAHRRLPEAAAAFEAGAVRRKRRARDGTE